MDRADIPLLIQGWTAGAHNWNHLIRNTARYASWIFWLAMIKGRSAFHTGIPHGFNAIVMTNYPLVVVLAY